ncbi:hypothetical protein A2U01_0059777, partial [Trifolium medium]|nr:hypothetical protein [Trifolium medium]
AAAVVDADAAKTFVAAAAVAAE